MRYKAGFWPVIGALAIIIVFAGMLFYESIIGNHNLLSVIYGLGIIVFVISVIKISDNKISYLAGTLLGILFMLFGAGFTYLVISYNNFDIYSFNSILPSLIWILTGAVILMYCGFNLKKNQGFIIKDELSQKIDSLSFSYSWCLSLVLAIAMLFLMSLNILNVAPEILLGLLIFFMPFSAAVIQLYIMKMGNFS
ncbi:hypothetical protein F1737_05260 [Methanoplanus sp. FWC-SCC4]|uniref:Uncharacterized protein n=1 Tax=Methanochimaera problematica TaxID=2609417 RepID=A0AA97I4B1_9EURY|nr:hypothetical protein [Methanoplanus sp. FWC-SCC4]WOF16156.1 hypothetical protein F1737_05260 [Methanoplanus sp. FWC-SCC4]